jgi:hypothetical protein
MNWMIDFADPLPRQGCRGAVAPYLQQIVDLDDADFEILLDATTWFTENPRSGLTIRQVPVPGMHTKWLARHRGLVLACLSIAVQPDSDTDQPGEELRQDNLDPLGLKTAALIAHASGRRAALNAAAMTTNWMRVAGATTSAFTNVSAASVTVATAHARMASSGRRRVRQPRTRLGMSLDRALNQSRLQADSAGAVRVGGRIVFSCLRARSSASLAALLRSRTPGIDSR